MSRYPLPAPHGLALAPLTALLVAALLSVPPAAAERLVPLPREVLRPGEPVQQPQVALAPDGSLAVAWTEVETDDLHLRFQLQRADGSRLPVREVATSAFFDEDLPYDVAIHPAGTVVVAYARGAGEEIQVSLFPPTGGRFDMPTVRAADLAPPWNDARVVRLHVDVDADGWPAVAWIAELFAGGSQTTQHSYVAGWSDEITFGLPPISWRERVGPGTSPAVHDLLFDAAGNLRVALELQDGVEVVTYSGNGDLLDSLRVTDPAGTLVLPQLAVSGGGTVALASLVGVPAEGCLRVGFFPLPADGGDDERRVSPFGGCQVGPRLDGAADAGFLLLYHQFGFEGQRHHDGPWLQAFDESGQPAAAPVRVPFLRSHDLAYEAGHGVVVGLPVDDTGGLVVQRLAAPPFACEPSPEHLCLAGGRFRVAADWLSPYAPVAGHAQTQPLSPAVGALWYFRPGNLEQLVKVLDGRPVNGRWWVFLSSLSSVEAWTMVDDLETGEQAVYHDPGRALGTRLDTAAFPREVVGGLPAAAAVVPAPSVGPPEAAVGVPLCSSTDTLCFHGGRFAARLRWTDPRTGATGRAVPRPVPTDGGGDPGGGDDTGAFWFFAPHNVEVLVKVLDGRPVNGQWWVFWGELTDLALELEFYDRAERTVRRYESAGREARSRADTEAFPGP